MGVLGGGGHFWTVEASSSCSSGLFGHDSDALGSCVASVVELESSVVDGSLLAAPPKVSSGLHVDGPT